MSTDDNTDDPFQSDWWHQYAEHAMTELVPKLQDSSVTVSIVPRGETDIKFALETGMSIMLDKPIILVVTPGAQIPDKLRRVADRIIESENIFEDSTFAPRLQRAIAEIVPE